MSITTFQPNRSVISSTIRVFFSINYQLLGLNRRLNRSTVIAGTDNQFSNLIIRVRNDDSGQIQAISLANSKKALFYLPVQQQVFNHAEN